LNCSKCKNDTNGIAYYLDYSNPICSTTCPIGQYIDNTQSNKCSLCANGCLVCIGISTNCTKCTTDSNGIIYYLNAIKN
jgi:hypothetical protein